MAGMRLFGKRCSLATDDFFLIGLIDIIIFFPWLGWIPVIYSSFLEHRDSCDLDHTRLLLGISFPGLCALFYSNWIIGALFVFFSSKGNISEPEPRRHVVTVMYLKLFVSALDAGSAVFGTVLLARNDFCDITDVALIIKVCTIFQWVATIARLIAIIFFYDWNFSKHTKDEQQKEYFTAPVRKGALKKWNLRLQTLCLWCTTPSEARQQALSTASELLALLSCDMDLVASDVMAGLLLYRQKCIMKWKSEKIALAQSPPILSADGERLEEFPPASFQPWMNLQLAKRYFNLGMGVFGWSWFVYRHLFCGFCLLFRRLTCCFPCRERSRIVFGDNCCGCNLAGLQATSELEYEDLVHVSFVDRVFELPFFVTFDHPTKAVVVTTRGTMSMNDLLTDCSAGFANMDDPGCPPGLLCHAGMLNAAREIKQKLERNEVLDRAFREKPDYQLIVTGHSLGAAVGSILTFLFKQQYPDIRCYAFAPPPTMSRNALPHALQMIFTVIYGNDTIVYMNYENVKGVLVEMEKCLKECKLPKYKVFMTNYYKDEKSSNMENNLKNYGTNNTLDVENKPPRNGDIEKGSEVPHVTESVYVVGTIVHIRRSEEGYRLKISTADDYKQLLFRPNSLLDHFPQFLQTSLNHLGNAPVLKASSIPKPGKEV